jgi:hypothetical protein
MLKRPQMRDSLPGTRLQTAASYAATTREGRMIYLLLLLCAIPLTAFMIAVILRLTIHVQAGNDGLLQ